MSRKPSDLLEFLRRSSPEEPAAPDPALEPTPRMIVLRRSQIVVAAAAGGLALLLVFLLGLALGGDGGAAEASASDSTVGVWVLRVVSYKDNAKGHEDAQTVKSQLMKFDLGDEVNLRRSSDGWLVVTVGAWLQAPHDMTQARTLKDKIRTMKDRNGAPPFKDADFWLIRR